MKYLLALAVAAALSTGPALAGKAQTFAVAGTAPDGKPYSGTVTLTESDASHDAMTVVWTIGPETIEGVGLVGKDNRKVLSIGYTYKGAIGVAIMTESDDKATGTWWITGTPGTGSESWTPVAK